MSHSAVLPSASSVRSAGADFAYHRAFCRTRGWVTSAEQSRLADLHVAIAGLGGVGGSHLLTLVRLGIRRFSLADPDVFELENFNRQAGARLSTVGRSKLEVLSEMATDINPEIEISSFPEGIHAGNIEAFLAQADIYLDGLDFFALDVRRQVFAACARRGIPAVTAAPLGMGAALLCFRPQGMGFEEYFRLAGHEPTEQALRFLLGLAPAHLHAAYLRDRSQVDLEGRRGPSTPMACELCAGMAGTAVLDIGLGRGQVRWAPHGLQFDAYRGRLVRSWLPWGNANPLQRLRIAAAKRLLAQGRTAGP